MTVRPALAFLLAVLVSPGAAWAACAPEAEPNDTMPEAQTVVDAFCIAGSTEGSDQDTFLWHVDAPAQVRLTIEGLPDQDLRVQLFQLLFTDDGTTAVEAATLVNLAGVGRIVTPDATLLPGRYGLLISSDSGSLIYRVTATVSPAATVTAEPALAQAGAFSLSSAGGDSIALPWTVDASQATERWGISITAPLGAAISLMLQDDAGAVIATAGIADAAGHIGLADLALTPGTYTILAHGVPDGAVATLEAVPQGARDPAVVEEPDDTDAEAFPVPPGTSVSGRLLASIALQDRDCLAVEVGAEGSDSRFDAVVRGPRQAEIALALLDPEGLPAQERSGRGTVRMSGLALAPGRQLFCVSGLLPPEQMYSFELIDRGPGSANTELEPNDTIAGANDLSAEGAAFGDLTGDDVDLYRLAVSGEAQLWLVQAAGEGLSRLTLLDSAGTPVAEARGEPTATLLRLPDSALLSGDYVIEVAGTDGRYLLRAAPIRPAASTTEAGAEPELEPNGDVLQAMPLAWNRPVEGTLGDGTDVDVFRLSLRAPAHVAIEVAIPGAVSLQGELTWGENAHLLGRLDSVPGTDETSTVVWNGLLPEGDHYLSLTALDAAASGYRLLAQRRSSFDLPIDLEPNDQWWRAAALPADGRLVGGLGPTDVDWYRLPPLAAPAEIVIELGPDQPLAFGYLQVAEAQPTGSWPMLDIATVATLAYDGEGHRAELPAGEDLFLSLQGAAGPYDAVVRLGTATVELPPPAPPVTVELAFEAAEVAAFLEQSQTVEGSLRLIASDAMPLELSLYAQLGDSGWSLALPEGPVALEAGGATELPVTVTIAPLTPDDGPVPIEVAVTDAAGGTVIAAAAIQPVIGAAAIAPRPAWPLPEPLLGGINVAWSALGGASLDESPAINDGFATETGTASFANYQLATLEPTLELAGGVPVDVLGVVINPGARAVEDRLASFTVLASIDGVGFEPVLSATLSPRPEPQAFVFSEPVTARFLRLGSLGNHGRGSYVTIAEFAAVAGAGAIPEEQRPDGGLDIARPDLGGHHVWQAATEDATEGEPQSTEWVLGFAAGRAALVTGLRWQEAAAEPAERRATAVAVAASRASASGPWEELGQWPLEPSRDLQPITLSAPAWARYLRFSATGAADLGAPAMPEHVAVIEAAPDGRYRSIVGAWGDGPEAIYEFLGEASAQDAQHLDPAAPGPRDLDLAGMGSGVLQGRDARDDWRLEIPPEVDRLDLIVGEPAGERLGLTLLDPAGEAVALERVGASAGETRYRAVVSAGVHAVQLYRAPASLAVLWDTSGSVQQMQPVMRAALAGLVGRLDLEAVAVNLYPFSAEPGALLADYTADRRRLSQAMATYGWSDSDSDAETALLAAAEDLFRRDGARAVVMFTDGENEVSAANAKLWQTLGMAQPAVVSVLMPSIVSGENQWRPLGLVRDWALVGGGFDTTVGYALPPYEQAWRRLVATLDRPAAYTLAASLPAEAEPVEPGTGFLALEAGSADTLPASGRGVVEVLLDVSGSMLQRIGDERQITVAQATLTRLVREVLPPGTPFALRVFGQGDRGSCDSSLAVPPGPLDPAAAEAAIAIVQPVDGARTPIAEALRLAAEDLAGHAPPRLVVLVTDGEETCGGDPAAELERLEADGFATRISILGFAVDDATLADTFRAWAESVGGVYLEADDAASLDAAMTEATRPAWTVMDADGTTVGSLAAGGPALELPAGDYAIDFGTGPVQVQVAVGETTVLAAP